MKLSTLLISMALVVCQQLSVGKRVFAQVPLTLQSSAADQTVDMKADSQERNGDLYHFRGHVQVQYESMHLSADEADYNSTTGILTATGNVDYSENLRNEHIRAHRAEYNLRQKTGRFEQVEGSIGGVATSGRSILTSTNPFTFTAEHVDRVGENLYRVYNGTITVCSLPKPTWTFSAPVATIRTETSMRIERARLRVLGVPVFYFPFFYKSLRNLPRNSGFLMPSIGNNSQLGMMFGDGFYWAINRSADAEVSAELLSKAGWSQRADLRLRPAANSYLNLSYYGVVDRRTEADNQGGRTIRAESVTSFPHGFRGVLDYNYLSSLTFRESFAQSYTEAVNSEEHSLGYLTKNLDSYALNLVASQTENFQSRTAGDTVRLRSLPTVELNSAEKPLSETWPLWISWDSSAGALSRTEPAVPTGSGLNTGLLDRLAFYPRLTIPLHWKFLQLTPVFGYRMAQYGDSKSATTPGTLAGEGWERASPTIAVDWTLPSLSKLYSNAGPLYGAPFRHVIEPEVTFRYVNDAGDFSKQLWFDSSDVLTNTTELEYSLTNRVYTKGAGLGGNEAFSWELKQDYYFDPTFGGALAPGQRNVFPSSFLLTGDAFLDGPRRFSPVVSLLRFHPSGHYDLELRDDFDPLRHRFVQGGLTGSTHWGQAFLSLNQTFVRSTPLLASPSNQVGFNVGYGNLLRKGWNAVFAGSYDVRSDLLQFTAIQASYNNNCCGISLEFRRFALGPTRNQNQFRVAFSLSNIGTFGTLKKQERLF